MKTLLIRSEHWAAFRSGQWAVVTGVGWLDHPRGGRPVYLVKFPDGVTDEWPVTDSTAQYEFMGGEEA